jgi:endogenous inhibitor of DNA gyrase (YacG/DUF329 family)
MGEAGPKPAHRTVACPACRGPSLYAPENAWRPFCSARCQGLDLGAWAAEGYRVAAPPSGGEDETLGLDPGLSGPQAGPGGLAH